VALSRFRMYSLVLWVGLLAGCGGGGGGAPAPAPFTAPSNLAARWETDDLNALLLTWSIGTGPFDGYEMEARTGTQAFQAFTGRISPVQSSGLLAVDTSVLPEGTDLAFRMRSVRGTAYSEYSNTATARFGLRVPYIDTPVDDYHAMKLTWCNKSPTADTLLLERGVLDTATGAYAWSPLPGVAFGTLAYRDTDLPEYATLRYRVTYSKGADSSRNTSPAVTTTYRLPGPLTATSLVGGVRLAWKTSAAPAVEMVVSRSTGVEGYGLSYKDVAHLPAGASAYEDLDLPSGMYSYQVQAVLAGGLRASSEPVAVVTQPRREGGPALVASMVTLPAATAGALDSEGRWFLADSEDGSKPNRIIPPTGDAWTVPGTSLSSPQVLLDGQGLPHTVYLQDPVPYGPEKLILHGWFDGSCWRTEEVARRVLASRPDFRLGPDGVPRLLWLEAAGRLEFAMKDPGGAWAAEILDLGLPSPNIIRSWILALDAAGSPLVVCRANDEHLLQRESPGVWTREELPFDPWTFRTTLDCVVMPSGDLELVFAREASSTGDDICALTRAGGAWGAPRVLIPAVSGLTGRSGIAVSADGARLAMACSVADLGTLLLVRDQGVWSTTILCQARLGPVFVGFDGGGRLKLLQSSEAHPRLLTQFYASFEEIP